MPPCYFNVRKCVGFKRLKTEKVLYGIKANVCHFGRSVPFKPPFTMFFCLEVIEHALQNGPMKSAVVFERANRIA